MIGEGGEEESNRKEGKVGREWSVREGRERGEGRGERSVRGERYKVKGYG